MSQRRRLTLAALLSALLVAVPLLACSVPVCRYALERWPADGYVVLLYHRGPLSATEQELANRLDPDITDADAMPNIRFLAIDLDANPDPESVKLWESRNSDALPSIVVLYPNPKLSPGGLWAAPLTSTTVDRLLDSPVRRAVARELVQGTSAVWILLESGDPAEDDKAAKRLNDRLAHLENTLELSQPDEEDIAEGLIAIDPDSMKLRFTMTRLSRTDPVEQFLVESLLGSEDDLREAEFAGQPMAFPVFGRGRALYALIGAGINEETIDEACRFLTGPCSCQVKEQNPGTDLLLSVNWDELITRQIEIDTALPPLTGLGGFVEPAADPKSADGPDPKSSPDAASPSVVSVDPAEIKNALNSSDHGTAHRGTPGPGTSESMTTDSHRTANSSVPPGPHPAIGPSVRRPSIANRLLIPLAGAALVATIAVVLASIVVIRRS